MRKRPVPSPQQTPTAAKGRPSRRSALDKASLKTDEQIVVKQETEEQTKVTKTSDFPAYNPDIIVDKVVKGRKKKDHVFTIDSEEEFRTEPSRFFQLNAADQKNIFKKFWKEGPYPCLSIGKNCGQFNTVEKAYDHNKKCIIPMYMTFKGRLEQFHALPKHVKKRYANEIFSFMKQGTCLNCDKVYAHAHGFLYHIERCGLDEEKRPWKCWRCGLEATQQESKAHLASCTVGTAEVEEGYATVKMEEETEEKPVVFGALGDVNLRSGKVIEKFDQDDVHFSKVEAQEAVEKLLGMGASVSARRRISTQPSISAGILPPESSRVRVSNTGQPIFRFKRSDAISLVTDTTDWDEYKRSVEQATNQWEAEHRQLLPDLFNTAQSKFTRLTEIPEELVSKTSVGFHFRDNTLAYVKESKLPDDLKSLKILESTSKEGDNDSVGNWISIGYAGGPVHTMKFAPNTFSSDEEVFLVVCYPDDEKLVTENCRTAQGYVQFWIVKHDEDVNKPSVLKPWFVLKTDFGAVLSATWLDIPNTENDKTLIGCVAISTAQGNVLIYRIDKSCVAVQSKAELVLVSSEPLVILRQEPPLEEARFSPPITRLGWSPFENCRYLAGVSATGAVIIWDLNGDRNNPKFLRDNNWTSPASDLCFVNESNLVVAFRDKCVRVYDLRTWVLLLEETTVRTAGARVVCCPRALNGFFTFQSEYFSSTDAPTTGITYICSDERAKGYFVLPLANRHDLQMWDANVHAMNGILATCGVDGQLLLSGNGRVASRISKQDSQFSIIKGSMLISKRRVDEKLEENGKLDCLFKHEEVSKKTWLEISLKPGKNGRVVPYSSLELRTQSLNVVATNHYSLKPIVVTAGQAGLLFVRPCRLDLGGAMDPLELISALSGSRAANLNKSSKKRGRQMKKEDDE